MKSTTSWRPAIGLFAVGLLFPLMIQPAGAQGTAKVEVNVASLVVKTVRTPEFQITGEKKPAKPRDWIEAEVTMTVKATPTPKNGYMDGTLDVEFFLGLVGSDNKPSVMSYTGSYKNIPVNEPVSVAVYISPAGFAKLTGKNRAAASDIKGSAVNVKMSGKAVGNKVNGLGAEGIKGASPASDILPKHKTPFRDLFYDRYLESAAE